MPLSGATASEVQATGLNGGKRDGHRERLRQRFAALDSSFDDTSAIELLLTYAVPRLDVRSLAAQLIERFGSLDGVLAAEPEELSKVTGVKDSSVTLLKLVDWLSEKRDWPIGRQLWWGHRIPVWTKPFGSVEESHRVAKEVSSIEDAMGPQ